MGYAASIYFTPNSMKYFLISSSAISVILLSLKIWAYMRYSRYMSLNPNCFDMSNTKLHKSQAVIDIFKQNIESPELAIQSLAIAGYKAQSILYYYQEIRPLLDNSVLNSAFRFIPSFTSMKWVMNINRTSPLQLALSFVLTFSSTFCLFLMINFISIYDKLWLLLQYSWILHEMFEQPRVSTSRKSPYDGLCDFGRAIFFSFLCLAAFFSQANGIVFELFIYFLRVFPICCIFGMAPHPRDLLYFLVENIGRYAFGFSGTDCLKNGLIDIGVGVVSSGITAIFIHFCSIEAGLIFGVFISSLCANIPNPPTKVRNSLIITLSVNFISTLCGALGFIYTSASRGLILRVSAYVLAFSDILVPYTTSEQSYLFAYCRIFDAPNWLGIARLYLRSAIFPLFLGVVFQVDVLNFVPASLLIQASINANFSTPSVTSLACLILCNFFSSDLGYPASSIYFLYSYLISFQLIRSLPFLSHYKKSRFPFSATVGSNFALFLQIVISTVLPIQHFANLQALLWSLITGSTSKIWLSDWNEIINDLCLPSSVHPTNFHYNVAAEPTLFNETIRNSDVLTNIIKSGRLGFVDSGDFLLLSWVNNIALIHIIENRSLSMKYEVRIFPPLMDQSISWMNYSCANSLSKVLNSYGKETILTCLFQVATPIHLRAKCIRMPFIGFHFLTVPGILIQNKWMKVYRYCFIYTLIAGPFKDIEASSCGTQEIDPEIMTIANSFANMAGVTLSDGNINVISNILKNIDIFSQDTLQSERNFYTLNTSVLSVAFRFLILCHNSNADFNSCDTVTIFRYLSSLDEAEEITKKSLSCSDLISRVTPINFYKIERESVISAWAAAGSINPKCGHFECVANHFNMLLKQLIYIGGGESLEASFISPIIRADWIPFRRNVPTFAERISQSVEDL